MSQSVTDRLQPPALPSSPDELVEALERLRARVSQRNPGLTVAEADEIAEELARDALDSLVEQGKIHFARER